ncbi:Peptidase family M50 [Carpediemonas membranifera]|uniref:Endopeptidase S2P n=1 Tax=Carpediemonas membranifera TaxID=201153 RepID=A0A8J6B1A4_9EUKA|nr:Peptidase family M50 [Carpediemonas membranifera]|eukprot:KAG9392149.1 Peptidase family M50 [Carpediemonas membranifera]
MSLILLLLTPAETKGVFGAWLDRHGLSFQPLKIKYTRKLQQSAPDAKLSLFQRALALPFALLGLVVHALVMASPVLVWWYIILSFKDSARDRPLLYIPSGGDIGPGTLLVFSVAAGVIALILHELGHYLALRSTGAHASSISLTLCPAGPVMSVGVPPTINTRPVAQQTRVIAAGVGVNLVLALMCWHVLRSPTALPTLLSPLFTLNGGVTIVSAPVDMLELGGAVSFLPGQVITSLGAMPIMSTADLQDAVNKVADEMAARGDVSSRAFRPVVSGGICVQDKEIVAKIPDGSLIPLDLREYMHLWTNDTAAGEYEHVFLSPGTASYTELCNYNTTCIRVAGSFNEIYRCVYPPHVNGVFIPVHAYTLDSRNTKVHHKFFAAAKLDCLVEELQVSPFVSKYHWASPSIAHIAQSAIELFYIANQGITVLNTLPLFRGTDGWRLLRLLGKKCRSKSRPSTQPTESREVAQEMTLTAAPQHTVVEYAVMFLQHFIQTADRVGAAVVLVASARRGACEAGLG